MEKEKLEVESFEDQAEMAREQALKMLFNAFLPPKEIREEVIRQMRISEMAFWKALKSVVDYKVQKLEKKTEPKQEVEGKRKARKINIE
jgi:hypothetical protein